MRISEEAREGVVSGFINTMCDVCFVGEHDSETYAALGLELSEEAEAYIRKLGNTFCSAAELHFHPSMELPDWEAGVRFGTDLYLSMQGYARAFIESQECEGIYGDIQTASYLDRLADAFGSIDPEVGDDGLVHIMQEGE